MVLSFVFELQSWARDLYLQVVIGCLCPINVAVYVKITRIYKKKKSKKEGVSLTNYNFVAHLVKIYKLTRSTSILPFLLFFLFYDIKNYISHKSKKY